MDDLLREFLVETREHLEAVDLALLRLERDPHDEAVLRSVFRLVHTIKGACGFLGLPRIEALAHAVETLLNRLREGTGSTREAVALILAGIERIKLVFAELDRIGTEPAGSDGDLIRDLERESGSHARVRPGQATLEELERAFQSAPGPDISAPAPRRKAPQKGPEVLPVSKAGRDLEPEPPGSRPRTMRVSVDALDRIAAYTCELVSTRNQLLDLARGDAQGAMRWAGPLQRLHRLTTELRDEAVKARMQPVSTACSKLPSLVRELSSELNRDIELVLGGTGIELDAQVLDAVRDPLMHLVRNSAAHGIENTAERQALGKPQRGTIRLNAYHADRGVTIELSDDGRGLDFERIRQCAREQRLDSDRAIAALSEAQLIELIFRPGFTTSKVADSLSGRGVGMDVVRTNIELVGGTVDVRSEAGRGMTVTMKLPLTLGRIRGAGAPEGMQPVSRGTVLLVDGDPFFREMLGPALEAEGYSVRTAVDADEGLALVLGQAFDAVVTDLALPGRPGLDLVDAMRRHPPLSAKPVVGLTARASEEALRRARSLGVSRILLKFDRAGLTSALADVLRPHSIAA